MAGEGEGGAGAPGAGAGNGAWYAGANLPQDQVDTIEGHGFTGLSPMIKSLQHFEGLARGKNVMPRPDPKNLDAWEGWEAAGWVSDRAKYMPERPTMREGGKVDDEMFNEFVSGAHELRLPADRVGKLYQRMTNYLQGRLDKLAAGEATKRQEAAAALETALKAEWPGEKYAANSDLARRAMTRLGFTEGSSELEKIVGSPRLVKMFYELGSLMPEHAFVPPGGSSKPTAQTARAERLRLEADPAWMKIFKDPRNPLHKEYAEHRNRLLDTEAAGSPPHP